MNCKEGTLFFCSRCGSNRVVGMRMAILNKVSDGNGKEIPTVTEAEIDSIRPLYTDPKRYLYYCFGCYSFGNSIWDGAMLRAGKPHLVD